MSVTVCQPDRDNESAEEWNLELEIEKWSIESTKSTETLLEN